MVQVYFSNTSGGSANTGDDLLYDGIQWIPKVADFSLLAESEVTGSSVASLTISSLPQTHRHIQVIGEVRTTASVNAHFNMRVNGLSTSIYFAYIENRFGNSSATGTEARVGTMTDSASTAGFFSPFELSLHNYTKTDRFKSFFGKGSYLNEVFEDRTSGIIQTNNAITSLTFLPSSGNFEIGTKFSVFGLGAL